MFLSSRISLLPYDIVSLLWPKSFLQLLKRGEKIETKRNPACLRGSTGFVETINS